MRQQGALLRVTVVVLLIVATVALRMTWEKIPRAEAQGDQSASEALQSRGLSRSRAPYRSQVPSRNRGRFRNLDLSRDWGDNIPLAPYSRLEGRSTDQSPSCRMAAAPESSPTCGMGRAIRECDRVCF